jgi:hypothetical protein
MKWKTDFIIFRNLTTTKMIFNNSNKRINLLKGSTSREHPREEVPDASPVTRRTWDDVRANEPLQKQPTVHVTKVGSVDDENMGTTNQNEISRVLLVVNMDTDKRSKYVEVLEEIGKSRRRQIEAAASPTKERIELDEDFVFFRPLNTERIVR